MVIVSTEFGRKQSHEIGPWSIRKRVETFKLRCGQKKRGKTKNSCLQLKWLWLTIAMAVYCIVFSNRAIDTAGANTTTHAYRHYWWANAKVNAHTPPSTPNKKVRCSLILLKTLDTMVKLRDNNGRKNTLVTQSCVLSDAWFRDLQILFWGLEIKFVEITSFSKTLSLQNVFSQCFILSTALCYQVTCFMLTIVLSYYQ